MEAFQINSTSYGLLLLGSNFVGGIIYFIRWWLNPFQKTLLLKQVYNGNKVICSKIQEEYRITDMEIKTPLREVSRFEKKIDINDD